MSPGRSPPLTDTAPVFAALGDPTRLHLVVRLSSEGPLSITRLSDGSDLTRQAITKHLRALAGAGLASDTRQGRESIWSLAPHRFSDACKALDQISAHWDQALGRLKAFVEEES